MRGRVRFDGLSMSKPFMHSRRATESPLTCFMGGHFRATETGVSMRVGSHGRARVQSTGWRDAREPGYSSMAYPSNSMEGASISGMGISATAGPANSFCTAISGAGRWW